VARITPHHLYLQHVLKMSSSSTNASGGLN